MPGGLIRRIGDRLWGTDIPEPGNGALLASIGAFFGENLTPVRFRRGGILPHVVPFPYSAVVIGNSVNIRRGCESVLTDPRVMAEEMFHVIQWARMGPIRMSLCYVWHHVRRGYGGNPIEVEAKQQADAFCASHKAGRAG
jgi:hypothetical protein